MRQEPSEAEAEEYFARLSVVFADPIRLKIVTELFHREMSPSGFHEVFGGGSLSRVAGHFQRLKDTDWLRFVRTATGGGRRGGVESFYRAPRLAIFDNETWAQLPLGLRVEFSWRIFEQFAERVKAAFEAGTFDAREDRHFTWTPLVLDERGRTDVLRRVDELFGVLFEEQADAKVRLSNEARPGMNEWLDDDQEPVDIDVEAALSFLDDDSNARLTLCDPQGQEIASVAGLLEGPEGVTEEGHLFVLYVLREDGMSVAVRFPADPATRCTVAPDGTVTGKLPGGAAWSVVPLDPGSEERSPSPETLPRRNPTDDRGSASQ